MLFPITEAVAMLLVLAVANKEDIYGYEIDRRIRKVIGSRRFTSGRILKKLHEHDFLSAYNLPSQGRNRKYYAITEKGRQQYQVLLGAWSAYKEAIDSFLS